MVRYRYALTFDVLPVHSGSVQDVKDVPDVTRGELFWQL